MLGAIAGDIIGSIYEWHNNKTKNFPLFGRGCEPTDDSIMTLAVAEGILAGNGDEARTSAAIIASMQRLGRLYPHAGYGGHFIGWIFSDDPAPYNSYGNGSAMRVSSVAWAFDTLADVQRFARLSAAVTHNHPEGIRGAEAVATAIFMARTGATKDSIRQCIDMDFDYPLNRTLEEIRPTYTFDVSCMGSVPEAVIAFLESTDYEDAVRNAVSIGGDSDTIACITGAIAEAFYGIPDFIRQKALSRLDTTLRGILDSFYRRYPCVRT